MDHDESHDHRRGGRRRGEEAFWGDYFNGFKDENPWVAHVPLERLKERRPRPRRAADQDY